MYTEIIIIIYYILLFPNLVKYYQAAQLHAIVSLFPHCSHNKWMEIEKIWLAPVHQNSLLWNANVEV